MEEGRRRRWAWSPSCWHRPEPRLSQPAPLHPPTPIFLIKAERSAKKAFIFLSAVPKRSGRRRKVSAPSTFFYSTLITFNSRLSRRHSFDFLHLTNEATLRCATTGSDLKQQPDGSDVKKRRSGLVYWEGIVAETMRARVTLQF